MWRAALGAAVDSRTMSSVDSSMRLVRGGTPLMWAAARGATDAIKALPGALPSLFEPDRSQTAAGNVSSVVGAARETGEAVAANVGWEYKVSFVLLLVASLNIAVGIFNLFPLLPLDGGHIAVVLWERIKARYFRLRGRRDPGLVDYRKFIPVSFSIFAVVCAFGVLLIVADLVNPVNIVG